MTTQTERERMTNVLFVVAVLAIVGVVAWGAVDFKAGWVESARARASLGAQP